MSQRNTIQSTLVYEAVNRLGCHATADEIFDTIAQSHPTISRATVYRNLSRLAQEGRIRRIEVPGGADRYDHVCRPHYHVRCQRCQRLFDVDLDQVPDLEKGIRDTRGFAFTGYDILFRGICPDCQRANADE